MSEFVTIDPKDLKTSEFHGYLLGAVAPRPIAFASTVSSNGDVNLSPFSFFNAFSSNPPILIFSPSRRVRDNTTKHTLQNVEEIPETVINVVSYDIVQQMSLASTEYEKGVNEFEKSGLTMLESDRVKPPRVKEAPASFECQVNEVIALGDEGGSGNLVVCEVLLAHFNESILGDDGKIDPYKLDAVGRLGANWYTRSSGESLFEVEKPLRTRGIGVDALPDAVRSSSVLTGNDLGRLGNVDKLPAQEEVSAFAGRDDVAKLIAQHKGDSSALKLSLHELAKRYLQQDKVTEAWLILMQSE